MRTLVPTILSRTRLIDRVDDAKASLVFLTAPAGYGKSTLARLIAGRRPLSSTCDVSGATNDFDLARRVLAALIQEVPSRANRLAPMRLASPDRPGALTDEVLDAWSEPVGDSVFVFENVEGLEPSASAAALLRRMLLGRPQGRTLVVCSRHPMRERSSRLAPPNEIVTLRADELAFDRTEFDAVFADARRTSEEIDAVFQQTRGWPIAALLFARFAKEGRLQTLLSSANDVAFEDLYDYLATEVLAGLPPVSRCALEAAACIPNATADDIRLALEGERGVDRLFADLPFVSRSVDGVYEVHPFMRSLLARTVGSNAGTQRKVASGHERSGRLARAAQLYALLGETAEAARLLDSVVRMRGRTSPPGWFDAAFADALAGLDLDAFVRHPDLWIFAMHAQRYQKDNMTAMREAEILRERAERLDDSIVIRATLTQTIASALYSVGRHEDALRTLDDWRARVPDGHRDIIDAIDFDRIYPLIRLGRLTEAQRCIDEARSKMASDDDIVVWTVNTNAAALFRMRGEREEERTAAQRATEAARRSTVPAVLASAVMDEVAGAWLAGEDELMRSRAAELDEIVWEHRLRGLYHLAACANGRVHVSPNGAELPGSLLVAHLLAAGHARSHAERVRALDAAAEAATVCHSEFSHVLTHVAIACADESRRAQSLALVRRHAGRIESDRLQTAAAALCGGSRDAGMLMPLVRRFAQDGLLENAGEREFSILAGAMRGSHGEIALSGREYDVMLALARSPRGVARDRLVATVWPDEDPERGRKALNSAVRRIRARVGGDVISYDEDVYRIAGDVSIDMWKIEDVWKRLSAVPTLEPAQRRRLHNLIDRLRAYRNSGPRAPEWFESAARRLGELPEEMATKLARDYLAAGDAKQAAAIARDMIGFDDLDETAWEILIHAMIAVDDRTGALREFRRYRMLLHKELGADPSPELIGILERSSFALDRRDLAL